VDPRDEREGDGGGDVPPEASRSLVMLALVASIHAFFGKRRSRAGKGVDPRDEILWGWMAA